MESSEEQARKRRRLQQQNSLPQYVKMQDVVTLPFLLTWLWGSGEASERINAAGNHLNNFGGIKRKANDDETVTAAGSSNASSASAVTGNNDETTASVANHQVIPTTEKATSAPTSTAASTPAPGTPKPKIRSSKPSPAPKSTKKKPTGFKDIEFKDGTAPIPAEINNLSIMIHACERHSNKMPVKQQLKKKLQQHFYMSSAHLKPASPLYKWAGDTRVFSKEEWMYLMGFKGEEGSEENPVEV